MEWLTWKKGRQHSGYERLLLIKSSFPLPFDMYIIRYKEGDHIPYHTDPAPKGRKHFRLNIFLRSAELGGEFLTKGRTIYSSKYVQLFRPDITEHAVSKIERGKRLVLSIGWLLKEKK